MTGGKAGTKTKWSPNAKESPRGTLRARAGVPSFEREKQGGKQSKELAEKTWKGKRRRKFFATKL